MPSLPPNPYIAGAALSGERGVFGREDLIARVEQTLCRPDNNAVLLYGQRRIGKTSILLQLQRRLPALPFFCVYFDLMDKARLPIGQVLYELASTVAMQLKIDPPLRSSFEANAEVFRTDFLPRIYQALGQQRRPVFLLDEFDVLDREEEPGLAQNAASLALLPYLRQLMVTEPRLAFVFVVGRRITELSGDFLSTFKAALSHPVSVLSPDEARALIRQTEQQSVLRYEELAVERIIALTRGHPCLTQLMCQLLFEEAFEQSAAPMPQITVSDVESVIPRLLEAGSPIMQFIWDGLPPAERIVFSAIATQAGEGSVYSQQDLDALLQKAGLRIWMQELDVAPKTLVDGLLLEKVHGDYRIYVDLVRRWVAEFWSLDKVRDELDHINPVAHSHYQTALSYYKKRKYNEALAELHRALDANPNHVKAHLLLGTIHRDEMRLAEAIDEFERAFQLDEPDGRFELLRTLLQFGDSLDEEDKLEEAKAVYMRVLSIAPQEQTALDRLSRIWEQLGDQATAEGNLAAAIAAYEQAGATDKLTQAQARQHEIQLGQASVRGQRYEAQQNWTGALEVYNELLESEPTNEEWLTAKERVEEEIWLAEQYAEGLRCKQRKDWEQAQVLLLGVVGRRADYRDAADLLALCARRGVPRYPLPIQVYWGGLAVIAILLACLVGLMAMYGSKLKAVNTYAANIDVSASAAIPAAGTQLAALAADQSAAFESVFATRVFEAVESTVRAHLTETPTSKPTSTRDPEQEPQAKATAVTPATSGGIAGATVTVEAMRTLTPTVEPTATADKSSVATAIAQSEATKQVALVTTASASLATAVHARQLLFWDGFDTNVNAWLLGEFVLQYGDHRWQITEGKLRTTATSTQGMRWGIAIPEITVKNFLLSVDVTSPDAVFDAETSIEFRRISSGDRYAINFMRDGTCSLYRFAESAWSPLWGPKKSPAMKQGNHSVNTLAILVRGSYFTIYVNGERLAIVKDTGLDEAGRIRLAGVIPDNVQTMTLEFDNLAIYEIP